MLTIVISGAYSNIGKTTLANNIQLALGDACVEIIKIGHNKAKPSKSTLLFHSCDKALEHISTLQKVDYLIIESNAILKFIDPDLVIYLMNYKKPEKRIIFNRKKKAHIIIDKDYNPITTKKIINKQIENIDIVEALTSQYNYMYN